MTLQGKEISAYQAEYRVIERLKQKTPTRKALCGAAGLVVQAHDEMRRFLRLAEEHPTLPADSQLPLGDLARRTEIRS